MFYCNVCPVSYEQTNGDGDNDCSKKYSDAAVFAAYRNNTVQTFEYAETVVVRSLRYWIVVTTADEVPPGTI